LYPFYYASPSSTLGHRVDKFLFPRLHQQTGKYAEILRFIEEYDAWEEDRQRRGGTTSFALAMNLLQVHPAVAEKTFFCRIRDKSDVAAPKDEPVLDCTNGIDYSYKAEDTPAEVNFAPKLNGVQHALKSVLCGHLRFMGAFQAQWGTAYAAMSHALYPRAEFDSTSNVIFCGAQCHSAFFFGRYHAVSTFFLRFQFVPTSGQFVAAFCFDLVMRLLAWSGFTWLFFYYDLYSQNPHCSAEQSLDIVKDRWNWFGNEVDYPSKFPAEFHELPGVPDCFSYEWMRKSVSVLRVRMLITTSLVMVLVYFTYYGLYVEALASYVAQYLCLMADCAVEKQ